MNETGLFGVTDHECYTAAANWAVREGVITSFEREGGTHDFAAGDVVSFEQMVTILSHLCAKPGEVDAASDDLSKFAVGADASPWSRAHRLGGGEGSGRRLRERRRHAHARAGRGRLPRPRRHGPHARLRPGRHGIGKQDRASRATSCRGSSNTRVRKGARTASTGKPSGRLAGFPG